MSKLDDYISPRDISMPEQPLEDLQACDESTPSDCTLEEGGGMSKQPEAPDELDQIFYQALRGKTVTPEQAHILEWAEARLKPALLAREERIRLEAEIKIHDEYWHSQRHVEEHGIGPLALANKEATELELRKLTNPIDKEKKT
jgi:hypothetical protein